MPGKISEMAAMTAATAALTDKVEVLDVSDTTMAPSGTNKGMAYSEVIAFLNANGVGSARGSVGPADDWNDVLTPGSYATQSVFDVWASHSPPWNSDSVGGTLTVLAGSAAGVIVQYWSCGRFDADSYFTLTDSWVRHTSPTGLFDGHHNSWMKLSLPVPYGQGYYLTVYDNSPNALTWDSIKLRKRDISSSDDWNYFPNDSPGTTSIVGSPSASHAPPLAATETGLLFGLQGEYSYPAGGTATSYQIWISSTTSQLWFRGANAPGGSTVWGPWVSTGGVPFTETVDGLVPAPFISDPKLFLASDRTWKVGYSPYTRTIVYNEDWNSADLIGTYETQGPLDGASQNAPEPAWYGDKGLLVVSSAGSETMTQTWIRQDGVFSTRARGNSGWSWWRTSTPDAASSGKFLVSAPGAGGGGVYGSSWQDFAFPRSAINAVYNWNNAPTDVMTSTAVVSNPATSNAPPTAGLEKGTLFPVIGGQDQASSFGKAQFWVSRATTEFWVRGGTYSGGDTWGPWAPLSSRRTVKADTTTAYVPILADENRMVTLSNAGAIAVTLPSNSTLNFPIGAEVDFLWLGVGQPTFVAGSGATVNGTPGLKMRAQYAVVTAKKISTNGWVVYGDLSA